ncbi:MAG: hypothetical protein F6K26_13350 [Moorea sp. SIO2I5]|nr:hypothetical protein [Moorena sp. SIO2I5]
MIDLPVRGLHVRQLLQNIALPECGKSSKHQKSKHQKSDRCGSLCLMLESCGYVKKFKSSLVNLYRNGWGYRKS